MGSISWLSIAGGPVWILLL